jgi:hypothetical protein
MIAQELGRHQSTCEGKSVYVTDERWMVMFRTETRKKTRLARSGWAMPLRLLLHSDHAFSLEETAPLIAAFESALIAAYTARRSGNAPGFKDDHRIG